jgi:hypothetical protein
MRITQFSSEPRTIMRGGFILKLKKKKEILSLQVSIEYISTTPGSPLNVNPGLEHAKN